MRPEMTKEQALALMDRVDALIEQARRIDKTDDMSAVNWGDIGAIDVVEEYSLRWGERTIYVEIEEADPSCRLAQWLTKQLNLPDVIVRAEW